MSNKIILKKSSVAAKAPVTQDLEYGELALNYADGKLYFRDDENIIQSFTANDSSLVTLTGTQTLTNKTLNSPVITGTLKVPTSNAPSQIADGELVFDSSQDVLTVGSGTGRRIIADTSTAQTLTNKTLNSPTLNNISLTGTVTAGGGVGSAGQVLESTGVGVRWITVSGGGGSAYQLPIASDVTLGGIKIGSGLSIDVDGIVSGFNGDYNNLSNKPTIPSTIFSTIAVAGQSNVVADSTTDTLTIVAGTNITITTNPSTDSITINSTATGGGGSTYELPIASVSVLGGIKIGNGLSVDVDGVVDVIGASGSTASGVVPFDFGFITETVFTVQDHGSIV